MIKRCVYSVITNNYDELHEIKFKSNLRFICFTDNKDLKVKGWETIFFQIKNSKNFNENRKIKMFPNKYLKNFDQTLYIDGNIRVKKDPEPLFDKYLKNNFLVISKHPFRDCLYEEAKFIKFSKKLNKEEINALDNQIKSYYLKGMPKHFGLWENNIILRKNNHPQNVIVSKLWWEEYSKGVKRDQVSFPFIIWLRKINIGIFCETPRINNTFFEYELHNSAKSKSIFLQIKLLANIRQKQSLFYKFLNLLFTQINELFNSLKKLFLKKEF